MSYKKIPSTELLAARRVLESISCVEILHDWTWNEQVATWTLHCRIYINSQPSIFIPQSTNWYVLVSSEYPWGNIGFYPAKEKGLTHTFLHQNFNSFGDSKVPWRDGKICLDTTVHALGRQGYHSEPYDYHWRLEWHFRRAIEWLVAASENKLIYPGDPFELPHFPLSNSITVAFSESEESFSQWQKISESVGLVQLISLRKKPDVFFIKSFQSIRGKELLRLTWGRDMNELKSESVLGIWILLQQIPVFSPWQVPVTWRELREVCREQKININEQLKIAAKFIRDGKSHIALIGFPIPAEIDGNLHQIHWQALQLPVLSESIKTAKGFRTNEEGYWQRDRTEILRGNVNLVWLNSENWHIRHIATRGKLPEPLASKKILLLGAGAIGSVVAEILSRGNAHKITILDSDTFEIGNLTRHTLSLYDLKVKKATKLATRLNSTSPHGTVVGIDRNFPQLEETDKANIQQSDIILDCTGSDTVLYHLEHFFWGSCKLFISISLGIGGKHLFLFSSYGDSFPYATFRAMLNPWLHKELKEYKGQQLPREGIGCWHPVFPARIDDVWMMASIAVKHIESLSTSPPENPNLVVFEQIYQNGTFLGLHQLDS
ncbi:ThiF family adenylyltransferase (plasmid) [Nostoc sp. UHCC 0302]|uniref:ThiF family adenylyltransferase n=1 Tax=Nostoc sp. UHCC 0302 TaxID=3134896 RepID=UPI00311CA680